MALRDQHGGDALTDAGNRLQDLQCPCEFVIAGNTTGEFSLDERALVRQVGDGGAMTVQEQRFGGLLEAGLLHGDHLGELAAAG